MFAASLRAGITRLTETAFRACSSPFSRGFPSVTSAGVSESRTTVCSCDISPPPSTTHDRTRRPFLDALR